MSAEQQKPAIGIIAIDIEKTGERKLSQDPMFAVGIATAPLEATSADQIKAWSVGLDLQKPKDVSWEEFWKQRGFEERCWNEFWSTRTAILDFVQDPHNIELVSDRHEMADEINAILAQAEEMYEKTVIVTDTTTFDTVFVGSELVKYGHESIKYTRSKRYRGGVEVDSYIHGCAEITDPTNWEEERAFVDNVITPLMLEEPNHNHDPKNDARAILCRYLAAIASSKRSRAC